MYSVSKEVFNQIHMLFQNQEYDKLYSEYSPIFHELLSVTSESDFHDFLKEEKDIDEKAFWLFYGAQSGDSVSIGGYEGDVTTKINTYFQKCLPAELYQKLSCHIEKCYIDMDDNVDFEEQIVLCNQVLKDTGYSISLKFDDTYYAGVYFISIALA